jgi:hypothetical protein
MKTFVVLAVSIVLVSILFCPMVMAAPGMPADLQIVQPDPSLPKELSAFFGKWEGAGGYMQTFLIVEKIDEEKASIYWWQSKEVPGAGPGWHKYEGKVIKEAGKYKLWYLGPFGNNKVTVKGDILEDSTPETTMRLRRVP